jgi:hypothetical protein
VQAAATAQSQNITSDVSGSRNQQSNVDGNGNTTSNTQNNSSTSQSGNSSCSGAGCNSIGQLIGPPASEQEREVALIKLKSELGELADFPDRNRVNSISTIIEGHIRPPIGIYLYDVLNKYYRDTIVNLPYFPTDMRHFQKAYSLFQKREGEFEESTITYIGTLTTIKAFRGVWLRYFDYYYDRENGFTDDQIKNYAFDLNIGTFDEAKKIADQLQANPDIHARMLQYINELRQLNSSATSLLDPYKND